MSGENQVIATICSNWIQGTKRGDANFTIHPIRTFTMQHACKLPLYGNKVPAGFPSPADDYIEQVIDLNELAIANPAATFFVRAKGTSMIQAGIQDNAILVVDRSIEPTSGRIVIAAVNGEFTVKRLKKTSAGEIMLLPENPAYEPIYVKEGSEVSVWGVVTFVLNAL